MEKLSVLIVDDNAIRASIIEAGLTQDGGTKVTLATGLHGLVERIETVQPDVIVVDIEHPSRDLLESYFTISRAVRKSIAMFVDKSDPGWIEQAIDAGVSSYVVDGLRKNRVKPIIDAAIRRFEAFRRMEMELEQTRSELQGRKHLDRAKSLLMRSKGLSEEDAYALLRRTAMNQNRKIGDVAERLLSAAELLSPAEDDGAAK